MGDAPVLDAELLPDTGEAAPTLEYAGAVSVLEGEGFRRPLMPPGNGLAKPIAGLLVGGVALTGALAGVPILATAPLFLLSGGLFVAYAGGTTEASILLAEPLHRDGRVVGWTIRLSDIEGRSPPERTAHVPLVGPERAVDLRLHVSPSILAESVGVVGVRRNRVTVAIDRANGGVASINADAADSESDLRSAEASLRRLLRLPVR